MNQLVDYFFSSFAGQFPRSIKDSPDPPFPQDVRFSSHKDCCTLIALTAAHKAQTPFPQSWVSSTSLIHQRAHWRAKRKATVQSSSTAPCPSTQMDRLLSDYFPSSSLITHLIISTVARPCHPLTTGWQLLLVPLQAVEISTNIKQLTSRVTDWKQAVGESKRLPPLPTIRSHLLCL